MLDRIYLLPSVCGCGIVIRMSTFLKILHSFGIGASFCFAVVNLVLAEWLLAMLWVNTAWLNWEFFKQVDNENSNHL